MTFHSDSKVRAALAELLDEEIFPRSKVEEHYAGMPINLERKKARKEALLGRARQAASWGVPDNESTGYSQTELCGIIRQLINYIEETS